MTELQYENEKVEFLRDETVDKERDLIIRANFIAGYENLETTKEYAERNYLNCKEKDNCSHIVVVNAFWVDYAKHIVEKGLEAPFLS